MSFITATISSYYPRATLPYARRWIFLHSQQKKQMSPPHTEQPSQLQWIKLWRLVCDGAYCSSPVSFYSWISFPVCFKYAAAISAEHNTMPMVAMIPSERCLLGCLRINNARTVWCASWPLRPRQCSQSDSEKASSPRSDRNIISILLLFQHIFLYKRNICGKKREYESLPLEKNVLYL